MLSVLVWFVISQRKSSVPFPGSITWVHSSRKFEQLRDLNSEQQMSINKGNIYMSSISITDICKLNIRSYEHSYVLHSGILSLSCLGSSPLQLDLDLTIFWVYEMVLLINSLVTDHVCKADINVAQSFLDQENTGIRIRDIWYLCLQMIHRYNSLYILQGSSSKKKRQLLIL